MSSDGLIQPDDEKFSGFVFKIQANMNPAHHDRLSFIRICSGKFERGMSVYHMQGGKSVKLASTTAIFGTRPPNYRYSLSR